MSTTFYNNGYMSINDVNRILHDYRNGNGSYERQNSNTYTYYVNSSTSHGSNSSYGNSQCGNNNGYYMSSSFL
jgi:hypothetical protein